MENFQKSLGSAQIVPENLNNWCKIEKYYASLAEYKILRESNSEVTTINFISFNNTG